MTRKTSTVRHVAPPLKVGALASRTGISVRALHHYDDIGLLSPSLRTPSGHRLYTVEDIARLQQIQALRIMGLSLDVIRESLASRQFTPRAVVQLQLERLEQQMALQQQLVGRLQRLARQMERAAVVSIDDLCHIIDATTLTERFFTPTQLAALQSRGETLGVEAMRAAEDEWSAVYAAVRTHMRKHTPPTDPLLQAVARRWTDVVNVLTGGDRDIARNVREMMTSAHTANGTHSGPARSHTPDLAMFEYMGKVFALIGGGPG